MPGTLDTKLRQPTALGKEISMLPDYKKNIVCHALAPVWTSYLLTKLLQPNVSTCLEVPFCGLLFPEKTPRKTCSTG